MVCVFDSLYKRYGGSSCSRVNLIQFWAWIYGCVSGNCWRTMWECAAEFRVVFRLNLLLIEDFLMEYRKCGEVVLWNLWWMGQECGQSAVFRRWGGHGSAILNCWCDRFLIFSPTLGDCSCLIFFGLFTGASIVLSCSQVGRIKEWSWLRESISFQLLKIVKYLNTVRIAGKRVCKYWGEGFLVLVWGLGFDLEFLWVQTA